jgi:DNA-binding transcriptional MerR regulator
MAFTAQQSARLANISPRMLRYWEETGAFLPDYVERKTHGPFRRIYTFRDLVTLRTLSFLRKEHGLTLNELRKAGAYLKAFADSPWNDLSLRLHGKRLVFPNPHTGVWTKADTSGQAVMEIDLERIRIESERDARKLTRRTPDTYGKITRNRYVMSNSWILSGTRIPIDAVLDLSQAGFSDAEILRQYPTLDQRDIEAVRSFDPTMAA